MSAIQSFISALRLKLGWMSSITLPKAIAPTKMGSNPSRPVLEKGNDRSAKAIRCTTLSLSSGAGGGASNGHSMVIVRGCGYDDAKGDVEILACPTRLLVTYGKGKHLP